MGLEPPWMLLVPIVDWALEPIPAWILRDDRQPPISTVSTSTGSTTHGSKVFEEKTPENSKVPNLNLLNTGNYLHIIYIVLGIISKLRDDLNGRIRRIYANMISFGGGSGINPQEILTDCTSFENRYSLSSF